MRLLKLKRRNDRSKLTIKSYGTPVNHLSAMQAGGENRYRRKQREIQKPGLKAAAVIKTQQPVERGQPQPHHSQQRMTLREGPANARRKEQFYSPLKAYPPAGQTTNAFRNTADNGFSRHDRSVAPRMRNALPVIRHLASAAPILILFFLGGCNGPQSALNPAGPSALAASRLWWGMLSVSTLILLLLVALWLYAMWRKPKTLTVEEIRRINQRWIIGGALALPIVIIAVLLSFGIPMGYRMLPLPLAGQKPLKILVTGRQWWWEIRYPGTDIVAVNELHMPAGVPVDVHVTSDDVIHSFWVPRLAGKIDMIPGRTNILRLEADAPGQFRGQCAEFCGLWHAHMVLMVKVQTQEDFKAWLESR